MAMSTRNDNLTAPRSEALSQILFYLYQDILARVIVPTTKMHNLWQIEPWRGFDSVTVSTRESTIEITVWLDGETCINLHSGLVPFWVAERMRLIWTECGQENAERAVAMLDQTPVPARTAT